MPITGNQPNNANSADNTPVRAGPNNNPNSRFSNYRARNGAATGIGNSTSPLGSSRGYGVSVSGYQSGAFTSAGGANPANAGNNTTGQSGYFGYNGNLSNGYNASGNGLSNGYTTGISNGYNSR